jgi:4-amino-4-deoxy-L-arabinose transferase-like glycosyltransferase
LATEMTEVIDSSNFRVRHRYGMIVAISLAMSGLALSTLLVTGPQFGMVWDESFTVKRERLLNLWFERYLTSPESAQRRFGFTKVVLDRYWLFSREEPHGHPPFYALIGLAGWRLCQRWLAPLEAYRFGPMLLTSMTVGVIYYHLAARRGHLAGGVAAVLLIAMPRSFAHVHYAHYDMPMTCLWLLAQVAFVASLEARWWAAPFGVALGLAAATKFTGLFAVIPAVVWVAFIEILPRWTILRGGRALATSSPQTGFRSLAVALVVAPITMYAIQPAWWIEPLAGPVRYLVSNLSRAKTQPLPTLYLGRYYDFALPWHNTMVLTAITTPVLVLVLSAIGIAVCWSGRREQPSTLIWPLSWLTLMIVRALPNAPGHDGIRLFLPSIASLAVLAGLGAGWLGERRRTRRLRVIAPLLIVAAISECLVGIARLYPYTDSYYNSAIGGLKGAERAGFEVTYYWETAGPEFLEWARAKAGEKPISISFSIDAPYHDLLREWGEIPIHMQTVALNEPTPSEPIRFDYFVLQSRRGFYFPADRWLDRHGHSVFAIRREGVDLLRVFTGEEHEKAGRNTRNDPIPRHLGG